MNVEFNSLNITNSAPEKGDTLIIRTKKSGTDNILVLVKDVINTGDGFEIILNKSTNSYFIWSMYISGDSWVCRVWNLGNVTHTASTNNTASLLDL